MVITRFILDLKLPQSQTAVYAVRDDTDITWQISFSDGGNEYILPDNVVAEMQIVRPKSKTTITSICKKINKTTVEYNFVTGYDEEGNPTDVRHTAGEEGIHTCTVVLWATEDVNGVETKVRKEAPRFTFVVREKVVTDESNITYIPKDEFDIRDMVADETIRKNNEIQRIANEEIRVENEQKRNTAESDREANENTRKENEIWRNSTLNNALINAEKQLDGAEERLNDAIDELKQSAEEGDFDGFSPTVNVEELSSGLGYKITITDINGDKSFFVYNGKTGEAGTVARYTVDMELDNSTYKLKLMLKDEVGNVVSEDTVDFPIEEMVVGADEKNGTITLTLKNGNTTSFYIGDLVDGLVSQKDFDAWKNAVPTITTTQVTDGYKVTFTDKNGSKEIVLKNGAKGDPGTPGTPGTPGADGKDYVLTDTDKDEIADKVAGRVKGEAIIDVAELPTEDVDTKRFYRAPVGTFFQGGIKTDWKCIVVTTLPDDALPVTTDMVNVTLYYDVSSGNAQGYANDMLSGAFGIPVGWYPMEVVCQLMDVTWNGIVFDEEDISEAGISLLIETELYQATNNNGVIDFDNVGGSVGWVGTGFGAEVFNTTHNVANGDYSHAEGVDTSAMGNFSHAEGITSTAYGDASHAEGRDTIARGDAQHTQGRWNIEDTENKYAHIVGSGESVNRRSNAHTLDWDGNAWFSGKIKVGGTGQDDENAKEVATTDTVMRQFNLTLEYFVTVWDMLTAMKDAGANINNINIVNLTGAVEGTYAIVYQPYGAGSVGRLRVSDLLNHQNFELVDDWSKMGVLHSIGNQHFYQYPLPSYDDSGAGKFLRLVADDQGVVSPQWVSILDAEGSDF